MGVGTFSQIYIQVVFAVKHRDSLIKPSWEEELYKYITGIIRNKGQKMSEEYKNRLRKPKTVKPTSQMNLENSKRNSGSKNANAMKWILNSPHGEIIKIDGNLKVICKELNLSFSTLKRNLNINISYILPRNSTKTRENTSGWKLSRI